MQRFEIPESIVARGNGLASIAIDVEPNDCGNAYAYIPDLANYRINVYSLRQNRMWSFSHNYLSFDPMMGDLNIGGFQFQWNDGIFSITLGKRNPDGSRTAYFHPMASISSFAVSTRVLKNETASQRSNHGEDFVYIGRRGRNTQSNMFEYDETTDVIFYTQIQKYGIACWNPNSPLKPSSFILLDQNEQAMIYPSDLSVNIYFLFLFISNLLVTVLMFFPIFLF